MYELKLVPFKAIGNHFAAESTSEQQPSARPHKQARSAAAVADRPAYTSCAAINPSPNFAPSDGTDFTTTCSIAPMSAIVSM
jgi:hypothetical protein